MQVSRSAPPSLPAGQRLLEGAHACLIQAFELPQARAYPKAFAAAAQLLCTALLAAHPSLLMVLLEPDAPDAYQPQGNIGRGGKVGQGAAKGVWAEQGALEARQGHPSNFVQRVGNMQSPVGPAPHLALLIAEHQQLTCAGSKKLYGVAAL